MATALIPAAALAEAVAASSQDTTALASSDGALPEAASPDEPSTSWESEPSSDQDSAPLEVELQEDRPSDGEAVAEPVAESETAGGSDAVAPEEDQFIEGDMITFDLDPIDADEALEGYVEESFARELGEEEPLTAQTNLTDNDEACYIILKDCIASVAAGTTTSTTFSVPKKSLPKISFTTSDLGVSSIIESNGRPSQTALAAFQRKLVNLSSILSALRSNCPYELYWMGDGSVSMKMSQIGYSSTRLYLAGDIDWYFPVSSSYAASTYQINPSTGSRVTKAVTTAKSIVSSSAGKLAYDRLAYFRQRICALTSYNTAAAQGKVAYGDPWQMVSVFDGDTSTTVVCEGYAKAFKYLCDLANISGVDCRLATGVMATSSHSEAHMWNIVQMPDGRNYLADVTNCDAGTVGADTQLFVVPYASGSVGAGYTFKPSGVTIKYSYDSDCRGTFTTDELTLSSQAYGTGVAGKDISKATASIASAVFTGFEVRPTPTVTYDKVTLSSGTDFTVEYRNNVNVGTATAVISGKGAYGGTKTVTFRISQRDIGLGRIAKIADQNWTGKSVTPALNVLDNGRTLTSGTDYTATYANNVEKGTASVTVTGKGNYLGTLSATFTIVTPQFPDVPKTHWAYNVVSRAAELGLITGYANGMFGTNDPITRGQVATILWRMAGQPAAGAGAKSFPDVKKGAYYYDAVRWASGMGVVSGFGNGTFGPNDKVTREQLAVMLANYASKVAGLEVKGSAADFASMPDADTVSSWARTAVGWCFKQRILSGGATGVNPKGEATRAQAAKMIVFLYDLVK